MNIEPATIDDAEAILELQKLAYQSEARLYDDRSIPPLTQTLDDLHAEFSRARFLKATLEGVIVGSVRATENEGVCSIGRLIVHPEHQGLGIGTRLMKAIEAMFPEAKKFELFTGSKSEGNIRLYSRLGYSISRTQQLSAKVLLVFMEKPGRVAVK